MKSGSLLPIMTDKINMSIEIKDIISKFLSKYPEVEKISIDIDTIILSKDRRIVDTNISLTL